MIEARISLRGAMSDYLLDHHAVLPAAQNRSARGRTTRNRAQLADPETLTRFPRAPITILRGRLRLPASTEVTVWSATPSDNPAPRRQLATGPIWVDGCVDGATAAASLASSARLQLFTRPRMHVRPGSRAASLPPP